MLNRSAACCFVFLGGLLGFALAAGVAGSAGAQTTYGEETELDLEPGVTLRVYDIGREVKQLFPLDADQTPNVDRRIEAVDLKTPEDFGGFADMFYVTVHGYLKVPEAGTYGFALASDDGSRLTINGQEVINNDGIHGATPKQGATELAAGWVPLQIEMFEYTGRQRLLLEWRPPGRENFEAIPVEMLGTERGVTRVVSPGTKRLLDGFENTRPGLGQPLDGVHPGWTVETLRPEGVEPRIGAMDFLPDGTLVYANFVPNIGGERLPTPNGTVWALREVDGGHGRATQQPVLLADGFTNPSGLVCVGTDIYISDQSAVRRLRDADGDGIYETQEVIVDAWTSDNYHHFAFGLQHRDGWLYGTLSTTIVFKSTAEQLGIEGELIGFNGPNPPNRGAGFRVNIETGEIQYIAGGLRTPNGVLMTDAGDLFVADNQGAWLPASRLNHIQPEGFYGHYNGQQTAHDYPNGGYPSLFVDRQPVPPAVWLPQNEVCNSPTRPIEIKDGPFAGQLYVGELTMGGIRRVFLEKVDGAFQGAAFRFTQGLECGVNQIAFGEDGCLYVGGTGSRGNWSWRGTQFGLERLRPTGADVLEFHSMTATPDGFVLRLTQPVDTAWLSNPGNYHVEQWSYFSTPKYGGDKFNEQRLVVTRAIPANDGRSVRLVIPGLVEGRLVYLKCDPTSTAGQAIWSGEAWYTLNNIPPASLDSAAADAASLEVRPLDAEGLSGFVGTGAAWKPAADMTLDGKQLQAIPGRGAMVNNPGRRTSPNIETVFAHGDAHIQLEFMIPPKSNSGVYLQGRYEVQVLDSYGKPDPKFSDCGGIYERWDPERPEGERGYEGVSPRTNAARPPGEWQQLDVLFRAPRFAPTGEKIANARFDRVTLNGEVIHENVEVTGPTREGNEGEFPFAPIKLQGDHGQVAYRNLVIRPITETQLVPPTDDQVAKLRVLLLTKTADELSEVTSAGASFFHAMAEQHGFDLQVDDDASSFTSDALKNFDVVVFLNNVGDVLDETQQQAFEAWHRDGGGFVGVHAAAGAESDWPWYGQLLGARPADQAAAQPARVVVQTSENPATAHLAQAWNVVEAWPNFRSRPDENAAVLLRAEGYSFRGGTMGRDHPVAWTQTFDGGRSLYTALGGSVESYGDTAVQEHLIGAVFWAAGLGDKLQPIAE